MVISWQAHFERDAEGKRQGRHLHFRVTGESYESRNNPLSYQSFIHPLHQQLIGQRRGYSQVMHGKNKQQCHGKKKEQSRERENTKAKPKLEAKPIWLLECLKRQRTLRRRIQLPEPSSPRKQLVTNSMAICTFGHIVYTISKFN